MKILTLNTWGGRAGHEEFLAFIKSQANLVDIFCLQEIWNVHDEKGQKVVDALKSTVVGGTVLHNIKDDLYSDLEKVLPEHQGFFRPHFMEHYGLATFVKKGFGIAEEGDIFVHKERNYAPSGDVGTHARNIQYITLKTEKGLVTIINFHGLWNGQGKGDSDERIIQSDNIINFLKNMKNPYVLCGDFNLLPETESLKKFENFGLRNLIKEFGITSTRTSLYSKEHRYADYVFVSEGIEVNDFRVLPEEVSDHSPILVDVN